MTKLVVVVVAGVVAACACYLCADHVWHVLVTMHHRG